MKRIEAAFQGKTELGKDERKIRRIQRAIDIARDNINDRIDKVEEQIAVLVEAAPATDAESLIQGLADLLCDKATHKRALARVEEVESYLNEDIEVEA